MRAQRGHTLIETLVVLAIIGTLMAMAMPHYVRAIRMAKQTAADEAKRQEYLVREDFAKSPELGPQLRAQARELFRKRVNAGNFDIFISEMLFGVSTDAEFAAYWHTLLNPANTAPLEFAGNRLLAVDSTGSTFELPVLGGQIVPGMTEKHVIAWDFLSTNMAHSSIGSLGTTAQYITGERAYLSYPGAFPATPLVASLSQQFMLDFGEP